MLETEAFLRVQTRRHFFSQAAVGLGGAALATLQSREGFTSEIQQLAPMAKRAIYLFMNGGPSQHDLFDHKPTMADWYDKDLPESVRQGQRLTTMTSGQSRFPIAPTKYAFAQHGNAGTWISELLPHTAKMADDLCLIRTMHTEAINHDPAVTFLCTGHQLPGRPSLGAWLNYGLGSMNDNLPTFMVMTPTWGAKRDAQAIYTRLWSSGFLPGRYSGVALRRTGDPVLFLSNPDGVSPEGRHRMLDRLARMNQETMGRIGDPETQTRIEQYEMAFRMQTSVPELVDISSESKETLAMYGDEVLTRGTFANSCLMARRMAERNVRFVQIFHRGWDQHGNISGDLPLQCRDVDQASWALVQDLKQRGLLDETLVIWGGEFGRTIYSQGQLSRDNYGRDHHPRCFSIWMAGGGIRPGMSYGTTDEFGYNVVEKPVHIHDLNATILHQMGINHERLTWRFQGRDFRLTDIHGNVIHDILS